jgi:hypothetical protein
LGGDQVFDGAHGVLRVAGFDGCIYASFSQEAKFNLIESVTLIARTKKAPNVSNAGGYRVGISLQRGGTT